MTPTVESTTIPNEASRDTSAAYSSLISNNAVPPVNRLADTPQYKNSNNNFVRDKTRGKYGSTDHFHHHKVPSSNTRQANESTPKMSSSNNNNDKKAACDGTESSNAGNRKDDDHEEVTPRNGTTLSANLAPASSSSSSRNFNLSERSDCSEKSYQQRPAFAEHLGKHRQYWRDIILGVNDGLVSTFLLVAGVAGGGLSTNDILLTAVAGAIAGAVSMYAGEFIATKSQDEVLSGEIALENHHVNEYRSDEVSELSDLLNLIGIPDDDPECETGLKGQLLEYYNNDPEALLKIMVALEFGVLEEERRSPCRAGITSCALFFLGSLPSVVPFAIVKDPIDGLIASALATSIGLFTVGAIKTWATRGKCMSAAIENLVIAGMGGSLAYGVGVGVESLINN